MVVSLYATNTATLIFVVSPLVGRCKNSKDPCLNSRPQGAGDYKIHGLSVLCPLRYIIKTAFGQKGWWKGQFILLINSLNFNRIDQGSS